VHEKDRQAAYAARGRAQGGVGGVERRRLMQADPILARVGLAFEVERRELRRLEGQAGGSGEAFQRAVAVLHPFQLGLDHRSKLVGVAGDEVGQPRLSADHTCSTGLSSGA
jgi:hypothetical protein